MAGMTSDLKENEFRLSDFGSYHLRSFADWIFSY